MVRVMSQLRTQLAEGVEKIGLIVMIAGNQIERIVQLAQQSARQAIFAGFAAVDDITGNDYRIGPFGQGINPVDDLRIKTVDVDKIVELGTLRAKMQIGKLGQKHTYRLI